MGSYTDEPKRETRGDLFYRAGSGLIIIAAGTWLGLLVYPKLAIAMGAVSALAVVAISAWKVRHLNARGK